MTSTTWTTWSKQHSTHHQGLLAPRSIHEAQEIITQAASTGQKIKVVGASRSSSAIAQPTDILLTLDYLTGLTTINPDAGTATFLAGTTVTTANRVLLHYNLAFENLGRLGAQTLAGAISTGTHGTGISYGIISTQVSDLTLLTSTGDLITCSHTQNPDIFKAALVGLGALGIIVSITFKVVPLFRLHAAERGHSYIKIVTSFSERSHGSDHYEFSWFPSSPEVRTRRLTRLPLLPDGFLHPHARISQARRHGNDLLLNNGLFEGISYLGSKAPSTQKALNKISNWAKGNRRYADYAPAVFTIHRTVPQNNMEYAFPLENFQDVMRDVRHRLDALNTHPTFPLVIRTAAADDIPLSQAQGRETFYVSAREYWRKPHAELFTALEAIFKHHQGRPHWGQFHTQDAEALTRLYPHMAEFTSLREELDPDGTFLNPYLDWVLLP